jgi:hypothetical protein
MDKNILTYNMLLDDFGCLKINNEEYIIQNELPYYDSRYKGHNKQEYYKAIAVKLGDEIDEDGFVPAYVLKWDIIDENKIPPCDWNNPFDIQQNGCLQLT